MHLFVNSRPSRHLNLLTTYHPGVDDAESECGLDEGVHFDWLITNEPTAPPLDEQLQPILKLAGKAAASAIQ